MTSRIVDLLKAHLAVVAAVVTSVLGIAGSAILDVLPPMDPQWKLVPLLIANLSVLLYFAAERTWISPRTSVLVAGRVRFAVGTLSLIGFFIAFNAYDAQFGRLVLKCPDEERAYIVPPAIASEGEVAPLLADRCGEFGDAGWDVTKIRPIEHIAQAEKALRWSYSLVLALLCTAVQGLVGAWNPSRR